MASGSDMDSEPVEHTPQLYTELMQRYECPGGSDILQIEDTKQFGFSFWRGHLAGRRAGIGRYPIS